MASSWSKNWTFTFGAVLSFLTVSYLFIKAQNYLLLDQRQKKIKKDNPKSRISHAVFSVSKTEHDDDDDHGGDDDDEQSLDNPLRYLQVDKWKLDSSLEQFIRQLPKVELHVHLDGTFDTDILWNFLQKQREHVLQCLPINTTLPWNQSVFPTRQLVEKCETAEDFNKLCTCRGYRSLHKMLECFEIFIPIVRGKLDFLEELAYDFCRRQAQQNVMYTEVRYSPHLLVEGAHLNVRDEPDRNDVDDPSGSDSSSCDGTTTTTRNRINAMLDVIFQNL